MNLLQQLAKGRILVTFHMNLKIIIKKIKFVEFYLKYDFQFTIFHTIFLKQVTFTFKTCLVSKYKIISLFKTFFIVIAFH